MSLKELNMSYQEKARISEERYEANKALFVVSSAYTQVKIEEYLSRVPKLYRKGLMSCLSKKSGAKQAIKQKCLDCCCWDRTEVAKCLTDTCPLWNFRPFRDDNPVTEGVPDTDQ